MEKTRLRPSDLSVCRAIHGLTLSGILIGMVSLVAVFDGSPRLAVIWLIVALVIDGIDGPLARRWNISAVVPKYDGHILDIVIDFVTCVFVPVVFAWEFEVVPHNALGKATIAVVLATSTLWFARTDMMTDDKWFRGFPAMWNLIVPTLWLLNADDHHRLAVPVLLVLSVLCVTDIEFAHPVSVAQWRVPNIIATSWWLLVMIVLTIIWPDHSRLGSLALILGPAWTVYTIVAHHRQRNAAAPRPTAA